MKHEEPRIPSKRVFTKRKLSSPPVSEIKRMKIIESERGVEEGLIARVITKEETLALDQILDEQYENNQGELF